MGCRIEHEILNFSDFSNQPVAVLNKTSQKLRWFVEFGIDERSFVVVNVYVRIDESCHVTKNCSIKAKFLLHLGVEVFPSKTHSFRFPNGETDRIQLFENPYSELLVNPQCTIDGNLSFSVNISKVQIEGTVDLPNINLNSPAISRSNVTLLVNNERLYCNKEILKFHSKAFRDLIEITDLTKVSLCKRKKLSIATLFSDPIVINLKDDERFEDFSDFIYHIHYPTAEVNEHNYKYLLHFAHSYGVHTILCNVSNFLKASVPGKILPKETVLLTAWKYDLFPLKTNVSDFMNSKNFRELLEDDIYKSFTAEQKIALFNSKSK